MFLIDCEEKKEYVIKRTYFDKATSLRALELGLKKGEKITVVKKYGYGGAVLYSDGSYISIGKGIASKIEVED